MKQRKLKILLIEDNPGDARLIKEALSEIHSTPVELVHVVRLNDGLLKTAEQKFDIVLLDLSLPDTSGLDTIRRAHHAVSGVPIIVLTGFNDEAFSIRVVHEGAQDFLVKGLFDGALLMRSIRYAIERKQAQEELKASQEFAINIIESSLDMIIAVDENGMIAEFNRSAQKTFGYEPEEVSGKPVSMLYAEAGEGIKIWEKTLAEGKCVGQVTHLRKNGDQFPASFSASVLKNGRGEFQGVVNTARDITEQLNLEAQLRHAQKMDSIGQLAAGVAHDFNNVLTVIQGYASLLLLRPNLASDISEPLNEISAAGEHAASLTRQLLTFSRKQTIQPCPLDVNVVLTSVSKMLTRLIGEDVALKTGQTARLPPILADAGMLEQIVINLAVNARDAMPDGGEIRITTSCAEINEAYVRQRPEGRVGSFVCLSVADNGSGMDSVTLSRIFEPFFTTKEAGKGTGLGLATVYGIVQSHQGWIEVESVLGKGTAFKIFFPTVNVPVGGHSFRPVLNDEQCRGNETIFVVEDVREVRGLVKEILESYGYNVVEAPDGVGAMSVWRQQRDKIDLLLTDVIMPEGISGRELAENLRAEKETLKIIYTSGHSIDLVKRGTSLCEGLNFLQKPYRALTLAQTVRTCLDTGKVS